MSCPQCGQELQRRQNDHGVFWVCGGCNHYLIGFPLLRRMIDPGFFNHFWQEIRQRSETSPILCPLCSKAMIPVPLPDAQSILQPLVCKGCNTAWLSREERAAMPAQTAPADAAETKAEPVLPVEASQMAAIHYAQLIGERAKQENQFDASHLPWWQKILAIVGLPIQEGKEGTEGFPWFTAALTLVTLGTSAYLFQNFRSPDDYGFIPRDFDRMNGLTFVSSFFVHGNWVHLLTNLYFLFVFGRVLEDKIGWFGLFLLILFSTIGGNLMTLCFDPTSDIPHVGASGGIAGVLLFYGLVFSSDKIIFYMAGTFGLMMPRLIRLPAWAALFLWILTQFFGAFFQGHGSTVSYSSHLGGLGVGFLFWLGWKWKNGGLIKATS